MLPRLFRSGVRFGMLLGFVSSTALGQSAISASPSIRSARIGVSLPTLQRSTRVNRMDAECDAPLGKRLLVGAATGAVMGGVLYSMIVTLNRNLPHPSHYAVGIIVPMTVMGALREAEHPSRLSCG